MKTFEEWIEKLKREDTIFNKPAREVYTEKYWNEFTNLSKQGWDARQPEFDDLKKQISRMKSCDSCKHNMNCKSWQNFDEGDANFSKWELADD